MRDVEIIRERARVDGERDAEQYYRYWSAEDRDAARAALRDGDDELPLRSPLSGEYADDPRIEDILLEEGVAVVDIEDDEYVNYMAEEYLEGYYVSLYDRLEEILSEEGSG